MSGFVVDRMVKSADSSCAVYAVTFQSQPHGTLGASLASMSVVMGVPMAPESDSLHCSQTEVAVPAHNHEMSVPRSWKLRASLTYGLVLLPWPPRIHPIPSRHPSTVACACGHRDVCGRDNLARPPSGSAACSR